LRSSTYVLSLVVDEMLQVEFDVAENAARLAELARGTRISNPDLGGSVCHPNERASPKHTVITTGQKDFRVYRRNKREAIRSCALPGRM